MRLVLALSGLSLLAACSGDRAGWAPRGSFWKLRETPTVQVRRGSQSVDRVTGELVLGWVGARALENQPELLACSLVVFDDRDGDRRPDAGEIVSARENLTRSRKVLFDDVRAAPNGGSRLRIRLDVRTGSESSMVVWDLVPD